jgi:hypothetical protein
MRWAVTLILLVAFTEPVAAELAVNNLFGSNMVLQRDAVVPVWGTATPRNQRSRSRSPATASPRPPTPRGAGGPSCHQ